MNNRCDGKRLCKGGDQEWERNFITLPGSYHRHRGMKCQDQAVYKSRNGRTVMLAADGTGDDDVNVACVGKVLNVLADFMLDHFDDMCKKECRKCSNEMILCAIRVIGSFMETEGTRKEELGSTLMGICVEPNSNRYCYIHLGDGIIAYRKFDAGAVNSRDSILSRPMNGRTLNQTILTISDYAGKGLRMSSGSLKGIAGFLLMTDGVYVERRGILNMSDLYNKACDRTLKLDETQDDQCIAVLFRKE